MDLAFSSTERFARTWMLGVRDQSTDSGGGASDALAAAAWSVDVFLFHDHDDTATQERCFPSISLSILLAFSFWTEARTHNHLILQFAG